MAECLHIGNKENSHPKSGLEIGTQESKCSKETLNAEEAYIVEDMVSPEGTGRPVQTRHEVNDDVEEENSGSGER